MEEYRLGVVETRFAELIWSHEPLTSGELVKLCAKELEWKKSTTYTVLKKLCGRGLLRNENSTVTVLAPREAVTAEAAGEFVDKAFGGSLPGFLAAFMSGRRLSAQEAEELKRLIDAHKEG